jgi:hypothetical protein
MPFRYRSLRIGALFSGLLFFLGASANTIAPGIDDVQWNQIIQKALSTATPVERTRGTYFTLVRMTPNDPTRSHHSEYFSVVGDYSGTVFNPMEVLQVSETWHLNKKGNWEIEQYFFDVGINGRLTNENHQRLVETPEHEILDQALIPNGGVNDPKVLSTWGKILKTWL